MNHRRFLRGPLVWLGITVTLVAVGSSVAFAQASQLGGKVRTGDEVVVPVGETVPGDLYASGGTVRVEGTVQGDLVASGGQVEVFGEVAGDLTAASGRVDVSGEVGGDVRLAAGQVTVGGSVGEDLFAAAGQVTLTSSGSVGEDFIFATGQTTLSGEVAGDVLGGTGNYVRRGTVGGTEEVSITRRGEERDPTFGDRLLAGLRRLVGLLIVGALLLWLAPRVVEGTAETLRRRPLLSLGVGVLGIVGLAILVLAAILVTVLLSIILGLLGLGDLVGTTIFGVVAVLVALGFLFFFSVTFGAPAGVGMFLGRLAVGAQTSPRRWGALVLGLLVVVVISAIPVVGGVLAFLIVLFGLGALLLELRPWRRGPAPTE